MDPICILKETGHILLDKYQRYRSYTSIDMPVITPFTIIFPRNTTKTKCNYKKGKQNITTEKHREESAKNIASFLWTKEKHINNTYWFFLFSVVTSFQV